MSATLTAALALSLCALIICSGFFSAAETAFTCFSRARMKRLARRDRRARRVLEADFNGVLTTLLICNNAVNIAATSISACLFAAHAGEGGVTLSTFVMTALILVFGEVTPKTLAKEKPEQFAMFSVGAVVFLGVVLKPLCLAFAKWQKLLLRAMGQGRRTALDGEELKIIVDDASAEGSLIKEEGEFLEGAIDLFSTPVREVMYGLERLKYLDADEDVYRAFSLFSSGCAFAAVTDGERGKIIGFLKSSRFFEAFALGERDLRKMAKEPYICPPQLKSADVFKRLHGTGEGVALVADGSRPLGFVTYERLAAELFKERGKG